MNRRNVLIFIASLVLIALIAFSQGVTIAQGPQPPGGDEPTQPAEPTQSPDGEEPIQPAEPAEPSQPTENEPVAVESEPAVLEPENPEALVTSAFTYQGQLRSNGAPVNQACDFIWDIYDVTVGGVALATDADAGLPVTNGLFTVIINVPGTLINGNARYVEIRVRCPTGVGDYTTLTPRQELRAAPYALGLRLPLSHTITNSGSPIFAVTNNSSATSSPSFLGSSAGGDGVRGLSTGAGNADNGVYGETNSNTTSEAGVKGVSTDAAAGGYFTSSTGYGVYGLTSSATDYGGYFSNSAATSGAAVYANGDAKQSLASDGFVKAAVYVNDCGPLPTISRYFNNVNTSAITVASGGGAGVCTVDFNFDVSARYIVATSRSSTPRFITFLPAAAVDQVTFYKFDANGSAISGDIMVLVY